MKKRRLCWRPRRIAGIMAGDKKTSDLIRVPPAGDLDRVAVDFAFSTAWQSRSFHARLDRKDLGVEMESFTACSGSHY